MQKPKYIDPEAERFYQVYPRFPGIQTYLDLLRSGRARGTWIDLILLELREHAGVDVEAFVGAYRTETNQLNRKTLLYAVAKADRPEYLSFFEEVLGSDDPELRQLAVLGLERLGTREARAVLWNCWRNLE